MFRYLSSKVTINKLSIISHKNHSNLIMVNRRNFLTKTIFSSIAFSLGLSKISCTDQTPSTNATMDYPSFPVTIATWPNEKATAEAWKVLEKGGRALDAVEAGAKVPERDKKDQSVGFGGRPDREGQVTLDACIMDDLGNCGSVCFLQHIKHPISVARKVMEETPHVMLVGEGALQFALEQGFEKEELLIEKSKQEWIEWKKEAKYKPIINIENHDTIGILAIDKNGNLSGACTTSGMAYKMHGRVGDSPIIGAGLFLDNAVGGAVATGMGEAVMKTLGSFLVVELMRQGRSPQEACEEAVMRIIQTQPYKEFQIGYLAINKRGEVGSYCIQPGFSYTKYQDNNNEVIESKSYVKE